MEFSAAVGSRIDAEVSEDADRPAGDDLPVLHGLRVLELTQGLAGPVACRLLAEFGADVLKAEPPGGDYMRELNPAAYASWNRGKRAVELAPVDEPDRLLDLLAGADVVVHDLSQSAARGLGLDDATLLARSPRLIAASVTGYPLGHPDEERSAHEILVQARSGAMDEQQALRPGPMFIRMPFASWGAAYLLAGGIVTRLVERAATGRGSAIHTSLLQAALAPAALYWQRAEHPPAWMLRHTLRRDNHPSNLTIFRCADDRWIHVLGGFPDADPIRAELARIGKSHLAGYNVTVDNRGEWAELFLTKSVSDWTGMLWDAGVICMPVLEMGETLSLPQAIANRYAVEVSDERFGDTVQAGLPIEMTPPARVEHGAPWTFSTPELVAAQPWRGAPTADPVSGPADRGSRRDLGLAGVRVLDFGAYVAGPMGAQCLADFGADVIKIEPPWGERGREINQFTGCQRGKRSLGLDLRHPRAGEVLRPLLAGADVVIHNVREAAARRLGIDADAAMSANPDVVYVHGSAYGVHGPWADFGAFDPAACALAGWSQAISGPDNRPTWLRNSTMDCHTGLALNLGAVLGLYRQRTTGRGSVARSSLLAVGAASASETLLSGPDRYPTEFQNVDRHQMGVSAYYRIYSVDGGYVAVAALDAGARRSLEEVFGVPAGASGSEFETAVRGRASTELLTALAEAGVAAELVAIDNRDPLFERELALGSGLVRRGRTVSYGMFEVPGGYWSDEAAVLAADRPIPGIGEHSLEILRELGFTAAEIDSLLADGVVSDGPLPAPEDSVNPMTRSLGHNL